MKRYIRAAVAAQQLNLVVDILFAPIEDKVIATDVRPIIDENGLLDDQAKADYDSFTEMLYLMIEHYDFHIFSEHSKTSGSFPYTSQYIWIAHRKEIEHNVVHKMIKLRVSDHFQKFSKESQHRLTKQSQQEANDLRIPRSKKKQLYEPKVIVVNNSRFATYEEALRNIELEIRSWLADRKVDISEYEAFYK